MLQVFSNLQRHGYAHTLAVTGNAQECEEAVEWMGQDFGCTWLSDPLPARVRAVGASG